MGPESGSVICGDVHVEGPAPEGAGARCFGAPMRATSGDAGDRVWLTVVERALVPSSVDVSRFMAGANELCAMRHPSLVRVTLVDREADFCVVGCEVLPGAKLLCEEIEDGHATDLLSRAAAELARGLAYLHRRGRLHGALAPGNVLVWEGVPMLWQHGLAELCIAERLAPRARKIGGDVVAPELIEGTELTPAIDVYAWGAVIASVAASVVGSEACALVLDDQLEPDPDGVLRVVRAALSEDPDERPADGVELLRRLEAEAQREEAAVRSLMRRYLAEFRDEARPRKSGKREPTQETIGRVALVRAPARRGKQLLQHPELDPKAGEILAADDPTPHPIAISDAKGVVADGAVEGDPSERDTEHPRHTGRQELSAVVDPDQLTPILPDLPPAGPVGTEDLTPLLPRRPTPPSVDEHAGPIEVPREPTEELPVLVRSDEGWDEEGSLESSGDDLLLDMPSRGAVESSSGPKKQHHAAAEDTGRAKPLAGHYERPRIPGPHGPLGPGMAIGIAVTAAALALGATFQVAAVSGGLGALLAGEGSAGGSKTRAGGRPEPMGPAACPAETGPVATPGGMVCIEVGEYPGLRRIPRVDAPLARAKALCAARGRRLCTADEWRAACGGNANRRYPYGQTYEEDRCNVPAPEGAGNNLSRSGARDGCVTPEGAFDLVGNVAEWVQEGTAHGGGADDPGASCRTASRPARDRGGPAIGFRCCVALGAIDR